MDWVSLEDGARVWLVGHRILRNVIMKFSMARRMPRQCFRNAKPEKESGRYEIYCPFKATPNDKENAPIRFVFELTKSGWKFTGLDNINE